MNFSISLLSVIPVRKEPSHRSEMTTQLLFGEFVETFEEEGDFIKVRCLYDEYEGWIQSIQLTPVEKKTVPEAIDFVGANRGEFFVNGVCIHVPFATPVYYPDLSATSMTFGNTDVQYAVPKDHIWNSKEKKFTEENFLPIKTVFINTPYLWGGKSIYGIDCSGFCQQVFKLFGIRLSRDSYQQATQGEAVKSISDSTFGDLAFFENQGGRITHVGILLGNEKIIHASGKVRIDNIDDKGIIRIDDQTRTHVLHSVRRVRGGEW